MVRILFFTAVYYILDLERKAGRDNEEINLLAARLFRHPSVPSPFRTLTTHVARNAGSLEWSTGGWRGRWLLPRHHPLLRQGSGCRRDQKRLQRPLQPPPPHPELQSPLTFHATILRTSSCLIVSFHFSFKQHIFRFCDYLMGICGAPTLKFEATYVVPNLAVSSHLTKNFGLLTSKNC